jgi:hypothetical protein
VRKKKLICSVEALLSLEFETVPRYTGSIYCNFHGDMETLIQTTFCLLSMERRPDIANSERRFKEGNTESKEGDMEEGNKK